MAAPLATAEAVKDWTRAAYVASGRATIPEVAPEFQKAVTILKQGKLSGFAAQEAAPHLGRLVAQCAGSKGESYLVTCNVAAPDAVTHRRARRVAARRAAAAYPRG